MASIQTNIAANTAVRNTAISGMALDKQIAKLSSGFRINRSGDDAAGLAIANKLRAEGKSLQVAARNASQAISMLQVADGAINTTSGILDRMKELASQANSDNIGTQRGKLDAEFQQLILEAARIAATTKYQGTALVDGTFGTALDTASGAGHSTLFAVTGITAANTTIGGTQAGTYALTSAAGVTTMTKGGVSQAVANAAGAQTLDFSTFGIKVRTDSGYVINTAIGNVVVGTGTGNFMVSSSGAYAGNDLVSLSPVDLTAGSTGLNVSGLDLSTAANAQTALTRIDTAIDSVNTAIGSIGAAQSRLEFASANVQTIAQNVIAAESTIRDADMAAETTAFTKYQILQQAGIAMLAQANSAAANVLTLLR